MAGSQSVVGSLMARLALDVSAYKRGTKEAKAETAELRRSVKESMQQVDQAFVSSERTVASYVKKLSGDRLLKEANNLTAATIKAGGATKLLATEKAKLGDTLGRAIAQYKRLGVEAPAAMVKLHRETKNASAATSGFFRNAAAFASGQALYDGITRIAGAMARAAGEAVDLAGTFVDLRSKTGHSLGMLQEMQFVAGQTGGTLEDMTNASFKLGVAISGGSNSVKGALSELRLELKAVQAMKPDQQWRTILDALSKVADQQERNRLGVLLMGRGYANVAAAVDANFAEMAKSAKKSTDEQLEELDRLGDEWAKFVDNTQKRFTGFLGQAVVDTRRAFNGWKLLFDDLEQRRKKALGEEHNYVSHGGFDVPLPAEPLDAAAKAAKSYAEELRAAERAAAKISPADRIELDAALKLGIEKAEDLEDRFFGVAGALRVYQEAQKGAAKETRETAKEMAELQNLISGIFGRDDEAAGEQMAKALYSLGPVNPQAIGESELERIKDTTGKAIESVKRRGGEIPKIIQDAYDLAARQLGSKMDTSGFKLPSVADELERDLEMARGVAAAFDKTMRDSSPLDVKGFINWESEEVDRLIEFDADVADTMHRLELLDAPRFPLMDWGEAIQSLTRSIDQFGGDAQGTFINVAAAAATIGETFRRAFDVKGATFNQAAGAQARSGIGAAALGGIGAAQGVEHLQGSQGSRVAQAFAQGASAGSVAGPYGSAVVGGGFALGALVLNRAEIEARRDARTFLADLATQFDLTATSAQKLAAQAEIVQAQTKGGPAEQWQKGWQLVRDAYEQTGQTAERALADFEAIRDAATRGPEAVAHAVAQINEQLARQNQLVDARRQKQELLNAAVERWGLTWEEAGKGFQRGTLATRAEGFIDDWKLLIESGADPDVLSGKMAEAVNAFVRDAKVAGVEIPEAMRPIIQTLIDQKLLLSETGKAYKSSEDAGIKWGNSLESMFERVLEKLERVIDKMLEPLPALGQRTTTPLSIFSGAQAVARKHTGGFIERAHSGLFVRGGPLLGSREVPIVAQAGEGIIAERMTTRLGGRAGIDAINAGRFDALFAAARMPNTFAGSLPDLQAPSRGAVSLEVSSGRRSSSSSDGDRIDRNVSTVVHNHIAPGAVVVKESTQPRVTADEIFRQLPRRLSDNDYGIRTSVRKHTKRR